MAGGSRLAGAASELPEGGRGEVDSDSERGVELGDSEERDEAGQERFDAIHVRDVADEDRAVAGHERDLADDERNQADEGRDLAGDRRDRASDERDEADWQLVGAGGRWAQWRRDRLADERDAVADGRDRIGDDRDQAAAARDRIGDERDEIAAARDHEGYQRDRVSDERDRAADERDRVGDTRDRVGGERDVAGASRDSAADERDRAADARDEAGDERDRTGDERDLARERFELSQSSRIPSDALERSELARREAAQDRSSASGDRRLGASERSQAQHDRDTAGLDRGAGAAQRVQAAADRGASASDRHSASLDGLTGAYNRGAGVRELEREIARAKRAHEPLTVAYLDVDGLKGINDSRGHEAGDRMLVQVVQTLRANLRTFDLVIRFGGDEFVCVLPGARMEAVSKRLENINKALSTASEAGSITLGLAELRTDDTSESLVSRADAALYQARNIPGPADPAQ